MNKSEMREYLTEKGFSFDVITSKMGITTTKIIWKGITAGFLFHDEVQLFDDTVYKYSRLVSVLYTHPRCLERVDRLILYLKTAELRRERRMRRERAKQVRLYFDSRNLF